MGSGGIGAAFAAVAQRAGTAEVALYGRTPHAEITVRPDGGEPVVLAQGCAPIRCPQRRGPPARRATRHATPVSDVVVPLLAAASDDPN